jgi:signal transduction histidine kinase
VPGEHAEVESAAFSLAQLLDASGEEIIEHCLHDLTALGNAVSRDPEAAAQLAGHYRAIIADVSGSLRAGRVTVDESYKLTARSIGAARAAGNIHPGESLQASSVFFERVLTTTAKLIDDSPMTQGAATQQLFQIAALALESSLTGRVREAFAAYTSFLLTKVHEAQVNERRRIARDLHDRIGHCVSVSHRQLELYGIYQHTDPRRAGEKVETAHRAVLEAMSSLRAVASDLYLLEPPKNLEKALLADLEQVEVDGVDLRLQVNGDESWAPAEVLDECFLVLREAGRNALRHAGPSIVDVNIDITPHELRGSVTDDGCGFDPTVRPLSRGMGIHAMCERAQLLGGSVLIDAGPGRGTRVSLAVPF